MAFWDGLRVPGEGPAGAESVLREERFGDVAEAVLDRCFVRVILRKGQDGHVTSELTEREQTTWDGDDQITRWLWRQGERPAGTDREAEVDRLKWNDPYGGWR
jgi:YD repeat-containing protein